MKKAYLILGLILSTQLHAVSVWTPRHEIHQIKISDFETKETSYAEIANELISQAKEQGYTLVFEFEEKRIEDFTFPEEVDLKKPVSMEFILSYFFRQNFDGNRMNFEVTKLSSEKHLKITISTHPKAQPVGI